MKPQALKPQDGQVPAKRREESHGHGKSAPKDHRSDGTPQQQKNSFWRGRRRGSWHSKGSKRA